MPIFLPFALGGLALAALGLGVKRALEQQPPRPAFPEGTRAREAWARHPQALEALKAARQRVKRQAQAYSERQERARQETLEPFGALLARLERWEHARATEVLTPEGQAALRALPEGPTPRALRVAWALWGVGAEAPSSLWPVLQWLENGWLAEDMPPVRIDGVSLYAAASRDSTPTDETEAAQALEAACAELHRATAFLDTLHERLQALDARVTILHGRAAAQLAYLDASSFEQEHPEPRERLRRLGQLTGALAEALRLPVLEVSGSLAPPLAPLEG
ncbi:hypothetical protein [Hyalangium rubrum]|uniref:Uncharacterized protein n=1 Tax=Hyalangium rubrum TaxID=3103134 RepID=A0ABU5HFY2_9BACT|nr:hypothetical protein [Hyalangium sp. s54d21]MDY7232384.1 hypothetical protein [Hyalangium sp. s54d21]